MQEIRYNGDFKKTSDTEEINGFQTYKITNLVSVRQGEVEGATNEELQ